MTVRTEDELGAALREDRDEIVIEGDLAKKVIRIRATGKLAWAVAGASLTVAIVAFALAPAEPVGALPGGAAGVGAVAILGIAATIAAVKIARSGGKKALKKLREYKTVASTDGRLVLRR